ncbi:hypothetical protein NM688_g8285 [Phlebia brevispora]|uniref:Uncharacterized protein n=1 Tax=Phlebia brevispora TaxID=194682 RepID=A0ACC1RT25_9APHY|nr:hypothetical protein NM688_g8285 [Phlebia brevispora]
MSSLDGALEDTLNPPESTTNLEDNKDDIDIHEDVTMEEKPASDDGDEQAEDDGMDLFGEEEVAEEVKHEDTAPSPVSSEPLDGISSLERKHREEMEYAEEDEPEQTMEESKLEAHANIPNIPMPRSSDGNHWVIRIPNFIKVDSKPFHPDTYAGPEEDEDAQTGESLREKSMSIKLKVENTVRWRWTKDENGQDPRY